MKNEQVELSNLDKVFWPEEGITKGDLLNYYQHIAPYILPYLKNRPLSLKRNPNGIKDEGFYQKDAAEIAPDWIKTAEIYAESAEKIVHYLVCNNIKSLLFIANLGCIEMNPWNSIVSKQDYPDYLVIDIDPSAKNSFDEVIDVALAVKEVLDKAGITGCCKTSGATGLHVYIPCNKKYNYEEVRSFAKIISSLVHDKLPGITTMERSLSKRRNDQIYIDYLQNSRGQTLASAYSARPRPGATVSTPVDWKEVKHGLRPAQFTIKTIPSRLKRKPADLFAPVLGKGINMKAALKNLHV